MQSPHNLSFIPPVIAHRGARNTAPENSMAAFEAACAQGAAWVETDVKITHDGIPILMHDDTLDRTTNGRGAVAEKTWSEIQNLDAGNGQRIPLLTDLLQMAIGKYLHLNLEIKPCPGRTQATAMVILIEASKMWPDDHPAPLISSFETEALTIAARLRPDWPRGLLLDGWHENWPELVRLTEANTINLDATTLTQQRVEQLKTANIPILAYTVNDPARAKELIGWGISAVFSDNPSEIIQSL